MVDRTSAFSCVAIKVSVAAMAKRRYRFMGKSIGKRKHIPLQSSPSENPSWLKKARTGYRLKADGGNGHPRSKRSQHSCQVMWFRLTAGALDATRKTTILTCGTIIDWLRTLPAVGVCQL
jgi:hypothetical protein